MTAALMALIWLLKMLHIGTLEFNRTPINIFIFIFIIFVSLQLFLSYCPLTAIRYTLPHSIYPWATKTELLKLIAYALIFFAALNTIKTKKQITRILSIIIAVGFIMSVFYLMRYFGTKVPRGFINRDHFSAYLGMTIPLALGLLFVSHHPSSFGLRPSFSLRFLLFFCVIVMSAALFFTMSRGGMFSFMAALIVMAVLALRNKSVKKRGWILAAVTIFIVLAIAWIGATPVIERILSIKVEITSRYFGGRLPIWEGLAGIVKDFPLFGAGAGTFNYIFPKYQPAQINTTHVTHAHSDILQLLSEVGIPFFFLSVVCGLWTVVWLFRRFSQRNNQWVIGMSIGLFGALSAIFFHSFTDFNLHIPANAVLLSLIMAITFITLHLKEDRFGQRTTFNKFYFTFLRRGETSHPIFIKVGRILLYSVAVTLFGFYSFTAVRPAIAHYYYDIAQSSKLEAQSELLQKANTFDPPNAKYHYHLGKFYSNQVTKSPLRLVFTRSGQASHQVTSIEQLNKAISEYQKAAQLNPTNAKYHQSLAWAHAQLYDLFQFSSAYSHLLAPFPDFSRDLRGDHLCIHKHFQQAIRLEPYNSYRYRAYAQWLLSHPTDENIAQGIIYYKKAIKLNPQLTKEFEKYVVYTKR